jgi:cyclophilin family peptidyl-prolyl cis-trans isomerase
MAQLLEKYPQEVRFVFRHFPLNTIHDKAALAAQATEAAGLQGKFWEMHDLIFEQQGEWSEMSIDQYKEWLGEAASELGLDTAQFSQDLETPEIVSAIQAAYEQASAIGLPGTPFLLFNDRPYQGQMDLATLSAIVESIRLEERAFDACPEMTLEPGKQYTATLETERGDIVIELLADEAPLAVNSFIFLANEGWFDGVTFHRVIPGFVAQAGDPSGTGFGGVGYLFDNEISPDLKFDGPGVVGMANAGPGTNGSQFFITLAATPDLDGSYTVFGRVISGMDVVEQLTPRDPSQNADLPPGDKILSVKIEEK